MDLTVTDVPDQRRDEARVDGELAAFADDLPTDELGFHAHRGPAGLEGKGVGSALVHDARDEVRVRSRSVLAVCPFVSGWLARHCEECGDLLHRSRTARSGTAGRRRALQPRPGEPHVAEVEPVRSELRDPGQSGRR